MKSERKMQQIDKEIGSPEDEKHESLERTLSSIALNRPFSRRGFFLISGVMIVGFSALKARGEREAPLIIMDQAKGLVIADPTRCVGCRRCELACTEFNDGKASPAMARIKIARNLDFGPKGLHAGQRGQGNWGNGLVIQDLCKQCPHPVPCANACPNDAIVVKPPTNARVVDPDKCIGCKMCQRACPWEMMSFDSDTNKATKCFLCDGNPKCVEACPAGALSYVAWRDLTDKTPLRVVPTSVITPEKAQSCADCHKG
ncbi:MAG TPA: 4Fe-4S dicluster domain-containing protein [Desulfomonilaceae bacterium]|nr:4Fe-4S dicluster domain-containing protein [Desulfomonilaceae bacterium]